MFFTYLHFEKSNEDFLNYILLYNIILLTKRFSKMGTSNIQNNIEICPTTEFDSHKDTSKNQISQ